MSASHECINVTQKVVGTPGRIEDFINSGKLKLSSVRFFIVDECDALLAQNQTKLIESIHRRCPDQSLDGSRLQMVVCSATLHNFNVKKLTQKLMSFPTWVDLKGEDSVPDTVHHCVVRINPTHSNHRNFITNRNNVRTDGVHKQERFRLFCITYFTVYTNPRQDRINFNDMNSDVDLRNSEGLCSYYSKLFLFLNWL